MAVLHLFLVNSTLILYILFSMFVLNQTVSFLKKYFIHESERIMFRRVLKVGWENYPLFIIYRRKYFSRETSATSKTRIQINYSETIFNPKDQLNLINHAEVWSIIWNSDQFIRILTDTAIF